MTITVGINTYISLVDARAYIVDNAILTELPSVDAECERLLKQASKALDRLYGNRYLGFRQIATNILYWPRVFADARPHGEGEFRYIITDSDGNARNLYGIPYELGQATVELALMLENGEDIYAQPNPFLTKEINKVDTLVAEREYKNTGNLYSIDPRYHIKLILRPLLRTDNMGVTLARGK